MLAALVGSPPSRLQAGGLGERARPCHGRRFRRDEAKGFLDGRLGCGVVPGLPQEPSKTLVERAEAVLVDA